ncbi:hypothetical protein STEG23_019468 [Scotinomys teguina]
MTGKRVRTKKMTLSCFTHTREQKNRSGDTPTERHSLDKACKEKACVPRRTVRMPTPACPVHADCPPPYLVFSDLLATGPEEKKYHFAILSAFYMLGVGVSGPVHAFPWEVSHNICKSCLAQRERFLLLRMAKEFVDRYRATHSILFYPPPSLLRLRKKGDSFPYIKTGSQDKSYSLPV